MKRNFVAVCLSAALPFLTAGSFRSFAQGTAVHFLNASPDARTLSVGGASAASEADAFAFWNNGASSALSARKMAVAASFGLWQPDVTGAQQYAVAGYGRIGERWSINAGGKYFRHRSYDIADDGGVFSGTFNPYEMSFGAGAGFSILPFLSVAASFNYIRSDIGASAAAGAFAADIGLYFRMNGIRAGLVAANLGSRIDYGAGGYNLPAHVDIAGGYTLGTDRHILAADMQAGIMLSDSSFSAKGGLEYRFGSLFRLAGGYCWNASPMLPGFASLGAGLSLYGVSLDVAYLFGGEGNAASNTLMFNLGYSF